MMFKKIFILLFLGGIIILPGKFSFAQELTILPTPRQVSFEEGTIIPDKSGLVIGEEMNPKGPSLLQLKQWLEDLWSAETVIVTNSTGNLSGFETLFLIGDCKRNPVTEKYIRQLQFQPDWESLGREGYFLLTRPGAPVQGEPNIIILAGNYPVGDFYAVQSLKQMVKKGEEKFFLPAVTILDYPGFNLRGVIEGFYGKSWPWEDKIKLVEFFGRNKLNAYCYAPKDDPKHRQQWRGLYTEEELQQFRDLIQAGKQNFVDIYYAISPGLTISYCNDEDFGILCQKIDSIYDLGIRHFGLFLDDLPSRLIHPQDLAKFSSYGEGQVFLVERLFEYLHKKNPKIKLIFCPTRYTTAMADTDSEYMQQLKKIPPAVEIIWTGPEVCSKQITDKEADYFANLIGKPPLVWDNYPVNDYRRRLHLGPLRYRSPSLDEHVSGVFFNPMNEPWANRIPLMTCADYVWNPRVYNPQHSKETTIKRIAGEKGYAPLSAIVEDWGSWVKERAGAWDEDVYEKALKIAQEQAEDKLLGDEFYQIVKEIYRFAFPESQE